MRPLAALHAVAASLLVVGLVLQVFLAGLGVFSDPASFTTHRDTGYMLELWTLVVLVTAAIARAGRAQIGIAALLFLLFLLQSVFVGVRDTAPAIAALHPVNGFLILLLSIVLARRAWAIARTSRALPEASSPSTAPSAEPGG
jgi:uncharacterized protein DUF6220